MRYTLFFAALLALFTAGCKNQYWTFIPNEDPVMVANTEPEPQPEPDVEPQAPKQIIFVLGIDGMD
jgi:hypothetical protein